MPKGILAMIEILKAEPIHALEVKDLLKQLGYESQELEIISALSQQDRSSEVFVAKKENQIIALMALIYFYYFNLSFLLLMLIQPTNFSLNNLIY